MSEDPKRIVLIGGVEFEFFELPLPDGQTKNESLIPHDAEKQKKFFPIDGELLQSQFSASRGVSAHILDVMSRKDDEKLGLPSRVSKKGFSGAYLNLVGDDKFFSECWDVLDANGWAYGYGRLSKETVEAVCQIDGNSIVAKSKEVFGDNWETYIAERASMHLTEPFTRVWYAANILSAYYARQDDVLFGYLWCEYRFKMRVEKSANTGSKVISGMKSAAIQTNAKHLPLRTARFEAMQRLVPRIGTDKASIECELQGLGKSQAIKRQWNRHQQKKRDR